MRTRALRFFGSVIGFIDLAWAVSSMNTSEGLFSEPKVGYINPCGGRRQNTKIVTVGGHNRGYESKLGVCVKPVPCAFQRAIKR